jgi:hypothetical protein
MLRYRIISQFNLIKKIYYYFKGKKFTGGLIFVSLILILKNKFSIFGFDFFKKNTHVDYYYKKGGTNKFLLGTAHDFEKENYILIETSGQNEIQDLYVRISQARIVIDTVLNFYKTY